MLNKASKIMCIDFLFRDEIFDGDVSEKRPSHSAPLTLLSS